MLETLAPYITYGYDHKNFILELSEQCSCSDQGLTLKTSAPNSTYSTVMNKQISFLRCLNCSCFNEGTILKYFAAPNNTYRDEHPNFILEVSNCSCFNEGAMLRTSTPNNTHRDEHKNFILEVSKLQLF